MRLPSVDQLVRGARTTLRRFPVVLLAAVAAATAALVLMEDPASDAWERLLASATLGIPLLFAFTLLVERRSWGPGRQALLHGLALAVLAGVFLAWPGWSEDVAARRYLQLSAGFHLLAAFLPFAGTSEQNGFWQYDRSLFLRFLTATLYAGVLFVGLALALAALEHLFGLPVPEEAYLRLWIVVALLFHPWFFLAGVPDDLEALESVTEYPKGLKIFTQYVLVPLVLVYLTILTAYAVKVMVTWDWPSGWIGWLVSAVAVAGILALLLVHPVRDRAENAWVRLYHRWFWVALLPSIALLLLAIRQRIAQYGVTEDRYFLLVLALWLAGVALFYVVRRSEDLRHVPRTLAVVVLVTFVGPWSAYAVSERSQRGRLESLLARNGLVVDGEVQGAGEAEEEVPFEDRREISATLGYLLDRHGPEAVAPAFGGEIPRAAGGEEPTAGPEPGPEREDRESSVRGEPTAATIAAALGMEYVSPGLRPGGDSRLYFVAERSMGVRPLEGFDRAVFRMTSIRSDTVRIDGGLRLTATTRGPRILAGGDRPDVTVTVLELARRLEAAGYGPGRSVPADEMWIEAERAGLRVGLWLESLQARRTDDGTLEDVSWSGTLFLGEAPIRPSESDGTAGPGEG